MFNRRLAYQFSGPGDRNWTPPWMHRRGAWDNEPHTHSFDRRRGFFGHGPFGHGPHFFGMRRGGPFGPGGFHGHGPHERGRAFGRGDVKYALLELLQEHPMHGYEMMKALEEKSGGFYTPSPGSIYPTLQMLEDRGFVTVQEVEGKKVYNITDDGRALLAERQQNEERFAGPPWMRGHRGGPGVSGLRLELQALRSETVEVARLLSIAGRMSISNPEQLARLRAIIARTRQDLSDLIYGDTPPQQE